MLSASADDPFLDPVPYATALDCWLAEKPPCLEAAVRPIPSFTERVDAMSALTESLYAASWSRYG